MRKLGEKKNQYRSVLFNSILSIFISLRFTFYLVLLDPTRLSVFRLRDANKAKTR